MSRTPLPFHAPDISAVARSLSGQIAALEHAPGHVEMLNMLVRAAGWRNFQHFRAQAATRERLEATPAEPPAPAVDFVKVKRLTRHFDAEGRLLRWPSKRGEQQTCLWVLWSRLPSRRVMSEPTINESLTAGHTFGDYALLRRWMCDDGMVTRTADGREYRRIESRPPALALALIEHIKTRWDGMAATPD